MSDTVRIIIVEDFHPETEGVLRELEDADLKFIHEVATNENDFETRLLTFSPDVILSPYSLVGTNAVKLLSIARNLDVSAPFIMLAYDLSEDIAIDLLGAGIEDYILRSTRKRLPVAIRKALQRHRIQQELLLSEAKLRESEASLRRAQQIAKVGSWEWEIDGTEVVCSEEMFRIYGCEPMEFTLADSARFVHPKDKERVGSLMTKGLKNGLMSMVEYTIIAADGTVKDVRAHAEPIRDNEGKIIKVIGTLQDVTTRKQIERELLKSQSLLSLGEEISHSGSFEIDITTKETVWSPNFYRITGIPPGTVITSDVFNACVHPDDLQLYREALSDRLTSGIGKPFVYRIVRPDNGQIVHLQANGKRVDGDDGRIRWYGSVLDISDRILTQLELRMSESSLNEAQKLAQLGSWEMDMETGEYSWSEEMYSIHGLTKQRITRELFMSLVHPDDREAILETDREALTGSTNGLTYRIIRPDTGQERIMAGSRATLVGRKLLGTVQDITERVQAQRELEAKTVQRDLVLSTAKIGVWHWTTGSNKLVWDDKCAQLFEDFSTELSTEQFYRLIHPEDRDHVRKCLIEGLKTGEYAAEYRLFRNGSTTFVLSRGKATMGPDGRATAIDGIIIDMTERHLLEASKLQSEQLFRDMAESISEVFWLTDADTNKLLYVSPSYESLYGSPIQEMYENPDAWSNKIHPEDLDNVIEQFNQYGKTGTYDAEYRLLMDDGSIKWVRDRSYPVYDASGEVTRIVGITEDITERKLAQEKIRTLSLVASETSNGVLIHNANGLVTWANRGFTDITGYAEKEIIGKEPWSVLSGRTTDQQLIEETYRRIRNGETFSSENILITKTGKEVWVATTFNPILDQAGRLQQIVSIGVDITRQKQTELTQKSMLEDLEKINRELRNRAR